jgi:hypothetical protein
LIEKVSGCGEQNIGEGRREKRFCRGIAIPLPVGGGVDDLRQGFVESDWGLENQAFARRRAEDIRIDHLLERP